MANRKSMLFVPGNNPGMVQSAPVLGADAVIFDLEDAVAQTEKDAARFLVASALSNLDNGGVETVVRINALDTPHWEEDIRAMVRAGAETLLLPKCDRAYDALQAIDAIIEAEESLETKQKPVGLMLILESALGVENAFSIATAHERVNGMLLGAEDFSADIGATRTLSGEEIAYARGRTVVAAKAGRVDAIDTPFTAVDDLENLERDAALARQMGFDGKASISPQHLRIINRVFRPTEAQIAWAERIVAAMAQAAIDGKGAVSVDGMMVDGPILIRARNILRAAGKLQEEQAS